MPKKTITKSKIAKKNANPVSDVSADRFIATGQEIFDVLVSYAEELGVKELHFEWQNTALKLRWRLGGKLVEPFRFDCQQAELLKEQVVKRFKIEVNSKLPFQERTIADKFEGRDYFLSVSVVSVAGGERFFLRIEKAESYDLARLNVNKAQVQCLNDVMGAKGSIVIVGAIKTPGRQKLLKAIAGQFKSPKDRAVLISEQPFYDWSDGDIFAIKPEIGFSRSVAIRASSQADYDYILLDLISTPLELDLALELAAAGKNVLIGLPWPTASKNFHYLWQLAEDKKSLRALVKGVITEFSLPKLCQHCRVANKLSAQGKTAIKKAFADLPEAVVKRLNLGAIGEQKFFQAKGCFFCQQTGFDGQENLTSALKLKKPGREQLVSFNFNDLISSQNFISSRQVAIIKASEGQVDLSDALSFMN